MMKKLALGIFQIIAGLLLGVFFIIQSAQSESYGSWLSMLLPLMLVFYGFSNIKEVKAERNSA